MWQIINSETGHSTYKSKNPIEIRWKNSIITNPESVANAFNDYFTNVSKSFSINLVTPTANAIKS